MLADIISITVGGIISLLVCEALTVIIKITRYKIWYSMVFVLFVLFTPSISRVVLFPYSGALEGMTFMFTFMASFIGWIFGIGTLCVCVLRDTEIRRRFIYVFIAFYVMAIAGLYYSVDGLVHPLIQ